MQSGAPRTNGSRRPAATACFRCSTRSWRRCSARAPSRQNIPPLYGRTCWLCERCVCCQIIGRRGVYLSLVLRLGIGRRRRNQSIGLTSAGEPAGHLLDAAVPAAAQPGRVRYSVFGRCGLPLPATSSPGLGSASPPRLNASAQATAKGVLTLGGADPKQYKGDIRSAKLSSRGLPVPWLYPCDICTGTRLARGGTGSRSAHVAPDAVA